MRRITTHGTGLHVNEGPRSVTIKELVRVSGQLEVLYLETCLDGALDWTQSNVGDMCQKSSKLRTLHVASFSLPKKRVELCNLGSALMTMHTNLRFLRLKCLHPDSLLSIHFHP